MLETPYDAYLERFVLATLAFCIPVVIGLVAAIILKRLGAKRNIWKNRIYRLLAGSTNVVGVIIGIISALGTCGVNIQALIAGLGLSGLAIGLALKDTVSNFVAGIMIIIYSPFDIGEELEISGVKGKVNNINLRYVTILTEEIEALIPNSVFLNSVIKKNLFKTEPPEEEIS